MMFQISWRTSTKLLRTKPTDAQRAASKTFSPLVGLAKGRVLFFPTWEMVVIEVHCLTSGDVNHFSVYPKQTAHRYSISNIEFLSSFH